MGNHHFQWENSLFLWPFSIVFYMFTRPGILKHAVHIHGKSHVVGWDSHPNSYSKNIGFQSPKIWGIPKYVMVKTCRFPAKISPGELGGLGGRRPRLRPEADELWGYIYIYIYVLYYIYMCICTCKCKVRYVILLLIAIIYIYICRMVPPSYKLVYKPHEYYSYTCHKP